jgi:hypothetical protein
MEALGCREVEATLSLVRLLARSFLGIAAAQPHQPRGQDAAHLSKMRREVGIDRSGTLHPVTIRIASGLGSAIM